MIFTQLISVGRLEDQGIMDETIVYTFSFSSSWMWGKKWIKNGETTPSLPTAALHGGWGTATQCHPRVPVVERFLLKWFG